MTSRIPSPPLDPDRSALDPERGTLGQCTPADRGPLGVVAGEAVLWQLEESIETHRRRAGPGRPGTHYGSEWAKAQGKKTLEKLRQAGLTETNCIELVLWAVERYYAGLAELAGPQPGFSAAPKAPECSPDVLLQTGHDAISKARDARSFGRKRVDSARGTTLTAALREDGWKTVYFSPKSARKDAQSTEKKMAGPAVSEKRRFVTGADSRQPVDITVGMDKVIIGFSTKNLPDDMKLLASVPFGVGFFNWGYHTFVVGRGSLYEVHWDKGPRSDGLFEKKDFIAKVREWEKYGEEYGAGSGVVAIPLEGWPFG